MYPKYTLLLKQILSFENIHVNERALSCISVFNLSEHRIAFGRKNY